jgi:hypothetical protein
LPGSHEQFAHAVPCSTNEVDRIEWAMTMLRTLSRALAWFSGFVSWPVSCARPRCEYAPAEKAIDEARHAASPVAPVVRRTPVVQFLGATTGFIVNYSPDHAVRFDLQGKPVETLTRSYRPMEVTLTIGRREMSAERFGQIPGTIQKEEDSTPAS